MTQHSLFEFRKDEKSKAPVPLAPRISSRQITTGTAARIMKVSQWTVIRLCESGTLRAWRVTDAGWWRIDYAAFTEYLSRRLAE